MKNLIFSFLLAAVLINICSAQTGWYNQYSNTSNELRDVYFVNQNTGWVVGWNSTILKTTNSGLYWSVQNPVQYGISFQSCFFINENTGWICGSSGYSNILKTTNGGITWFLQLHSSNGILTGTYFTSSQNGCVVGYGGTILTTSNGGSNWIQRYSGVSVNLTNVFFVDENTGWVTGDNGIILKTSTAGAVWSPYLSGVSQNLEGIYFLSPGTGIICGNNGTILKTTDSGINWIPKFSGSSNWLNSISFVNENTGWIAGGNYDFYGQVLKTTNAGESWISQTIPLTGWLANIYFTGYNFGWAAGNSGKIISTISGGMPPPPVPLLVYPSQNAINIPLNATFRWNTSTGATHYSIHISPVPQFAVITDTAFVDTNFYNIPEGKLNNNLTYFWHVKAYNQAGSSQWSSTFMFSTLTTGINTIPAEIPKLFKLYDPYPNPFNPSTKIRIDIPMNSETSIRIFDISGRLVETIYNGLVTAGSHEVSWGAEKFNSGVYILQIVSKDFVSAKKLILLK